MSEIRHDPLSGEWVLIAPERKSRHGALSYAPEVLTESPKDCPFCPGNEAQTPPEILREGTDAWSLRVVPNRHPAIDLTGPAIGAHEVVIETSRHVRELTATELDAVLGAFASRWSFHRDAGARYISIFRNRGRAAGASIEHPHSQIIALPEVPPRIAHERDLYRSGQCPLCRMTGEKVRIVAESAGAVLLSPYAARFPWELWILPKSHSTRFETLTADERSSLAILVTNALAALDRLYPALPYNLAFHLPPIDDRIADPHFHWRIEIIPRLTIPGGFEWGTGAFINIASPEESAEELRTVLLPAGEGGRVERPDEGLGTKAPE